LAIYFFKLKILQIPTTNGHFRYYMNSVIGILKKKRLLVVSSNCSNVPPRRIHCQHFSDSSLDLPSLQWKDMRRKESIKEAKRWKYIERKIYRDLQRGEGFTPKYLLNFGAPPLSLSASAGPSNLEGTTSKTFSYINHPKITNGGWKPNSPILWEIEANPKN